MGLLAAAQASEPSATPSPSAAPSPQVEERGQAILKQLIEVNRNWLLTPPDTVTNYGYVFHKPEGEEETYHFDQTPVRVTSPASATAIRRQGLAYRSLLHYLAKDPARVHIRSLVEQDGQIILDIEVGPAAAGLTNHTRPPLPEAPEEWPKGMGRIGQRGRTFGGECGHGIGGSAYGWFGFESAGGQLVIDAKRMVPLRSAARPIRSAGVVEEIFSDYAEITPGHWAPLAIAVQGFGLQFQWQFKLHPGGLWLFDQSRYRDRKVAYVDQVIINRPVTELPLESTPTPRAAPQPRLPLLTQAQMLEDYDRFTVIMEQVFPLTEVNRLVYGVDTRSMLIENRKRLKDITTTEKFAELMDATVTSCRGNHFYVGCSAATTNKYFKGFVADEAYALANLYGAHLARVHQGNNLDLPLLYFEGSYYTLHDFTHRNTTYPRGMKLLACNGKAPDAIVSSLVQSGVSLNWDYDARKFYSPDFYKHCPLSKTNALLAQFQKEDGTKCELALAPEEPLSYQPPWAARDLLVTLVNGSILYIRLPMMDPTLENYWNNELPKHRSDPIRKVVVDIRNNPGGGDPAWFSLLRLLIKNGFTRSMKLAVKDSAINRDYLPRSPLSAMMQTGRNERIGFLNNEEFKTGGGSGYFSPATNSLNLSCKIYVLTENIYSAAGNFVHCCPHNDQLVSVGLQNGMMLGVGTLPYAFSLPNSKLIFTIEPVLDLTDARTARGTHHIGVKVRIKPTLHQLLDYYNTGDDAGLEDRLNKHDPLFQRVLESE